jgi:DNA replication protein DnaC
MNYYCQVPFLILDDLGAEQITDSGWVADRMYQIIGTRHGDDRPTFFTSNCTPTELADRLGDRIMSRVLEMCGFPNPGHRIVHVEGPNLRAERK